MSFRTFTILDKNGNKTIITIFDKIYSSDFINADGYFQTQKKFGLKA